MFLIYGLIVGIIATLIFDLFQISLSYAYNINKSKWNLIGRYFIGVIKNNKFFVDNIEEEEIIDNELLIGYLVHYAIGSIFGLFYVSINLIFYSEPSLILALIIGIITVLGGWCIIMPYTYNIGFFASKKEEQFQILAQNLIAHFIFGIGLYIGFLIQY